MKMRISNKDRLAIEVEDKDMNRKDRCKCGRLKYKVSKQCSECFKKHKRKEEVLNEPDSTVS